MSLLQVRRTMTGWGLWLTPGWTSFSWSCFSIGVHFIMIVDCTGWILNKVFLFRTDVFIVCFCIVSMKSFKNVREKVNCHTKRSQPTEMKREDEVKVKCSGCQSWPTMDRLCLFSWWGLKLISGEARWDPFQRQNFVFGQSDRNSYFQFRTAVGSITAFEPHIKAIGCISNYTRL